MTARDVLRIHATQFDNTSCVPIQLSLSLFRSLTLWLSLRLRAIGPLCWGKHCSSQLAGPCEVIAEPRCRTSPFGMIQNKHTLRCCCFASVWNARRRNITCDKLKRGNPKGFPVLSGTSRYPQWHPLLFTCPALAHIACIRSHYRAPFRLFSPLTLAIRLRPDLGCTALQGVQAMFVFPHPINNISTVQITFTYIHA